MPVPIICLDDELCHFLEGYRPLMSKPQYQYFVIVLLGLMLCEGRRTLVGLLEQVAESTSMSGLSRFLAEAPWDAQAVGQQWLKDFRNRMQPVVEAEHERQRRTQPRRRGRPKPPLVTGYLIGDDSTMRHPRKARKWRGWASIIRRPPSGVCPAIAWWRSCTCCWTSAVRWCRSCTGSRRSVSKKVCRFRARSS